MLKNIQLLNPGIVALPFIGNSDKPSMLGAYNFMYPTQEKLRMSFYYRDGFLYRKEKTSNNATITERAGYHNKQRNVQVVSFENKQYKEHILIWIWHNGEIPNGFVIDHRDRNSMNNAISNLRICTQGQNLMNLSIGRSNNKSGYKGVSWNADRNKWVSRINLNGKVKQMGYFDSKIDAAIAYNKAALELHGDFANLNIIK